MRLSIAIEFTDGEGPLPPAFRGNHSADYTGPLAPFIAQLAAAYLRVPAILASERIAHNKAIVTGLGSSANSGAKLNRSA